MSVLTSMSSSLCSAGHTSMRNLMSVHQPINLPLEDHCQNFCKRFVLSNVLLCILIAFNLPQNPKFVNCGQCSFLVSAIDPLNLLYDKLCIIHCQLNWYKKVKSISIDREYLMLCIIGNIIEGLLIVSDNNE